MDSEVEGVKRERLMDRRPRPKLLLPILVAVAAILVAGCGSSGSSSETTGGSTSEGAGAAEEGAGAEESSTTSSGGEESGGGEVSIKKMSIIVPEKATDYGFNQAGVEGAETVANEDNIELEVAEEAGYEDITPILEEFATNGSEFIIAHAGGYNTIAPEIAEQTGVPTLVGENPEAMVPGLVANWKSEISEGSYMAGVLAAKTSKSHKLGIVISADSTVWNRMSGGFVVGARSVDPSIEITLAQISQAGFADVAGGKRVAKAEIGAGADVIFGMGDGASFGYLKAVEEAPGVKFIDVIGDKTPIDHKHVLLSSVLWKYENVFREAVEDLDKGTFGEKEYVLSLEGEGISLLKTPLISSSVWNELEAIKKELIAGKIKVPLTEEKSEVEALIKQG